MRQLENNLPQSTVVLPATSALRQDAFPSLHEFLTANGSRWCRIQIKPNRVLMSFKGLKKSYYYGTGKDLYEAYEMLRERVLLFPA